MDLQKELFSKKGVVASSFKTSEDVAAFLDHNWQGTYTKDTLDRMKALDKELGNPSQACKVVFVSGTNSKSLTIHFTQRLFNEEKITCGIYLTPHFISYKERFLIGEQEANERSFMDAAQSVADAALRLGIKPSSSEILCMMALVLFKKHNAELALIELDQHSMFHPFAICTPAIITITRITQSATVETDAALLEQMDALMSFATPQTFIITGDQIKQHTNHLQKRTKEKGANWVMPIRKLAMLPYPYEQIHGRAAALAERISQTFIKNFIEPVVVAQQNSLLIKTKRCKGRPTLEAKKYLELNPTRTIDAYWRETIAQLPARFQLIKNKSPRVLLDNASNLDAIENVLFGIRLLHYKSPFKGVAIILATTQDNLENETFVKALRYFFKKTNGSIALCPIEKFTPGTFEVNTWNPEKVCNDMKIAKIKARCFDSFDAAFEYSSKVVDQQEGLVAVIGSSSIVSQYLKQA